MSQFFVRARNVASRTRSGELLPGKQLSHTVAVRKNDATFQPIVGVVFDTGAQHTVIPAAVADKYGIPYSKDGSLAVDLKGATGKAVGYAGQATLRIHGLPGWEFEVPCLFVEGAERMLLGLPDQLRNFDFKSLLGGEGPDPMAAGVLYSLRADHAGRSVQ